MRIRKGARIAFPPLPARLLGVAIPYFGRMRIMIKIVSNQQVLQPKKQKLQDFSMAMQFSKRRKLGLFGIEGADQTDHIFEVGDGHELVAAMHGKLRQSDVAAGQGEFRIRDIP